MWHQRAAPGICLVCLFSVGLQGLRVCQLLCFLPALPPLGAILPLTGVEGAQDPCRDLRKRGLGDGISPWATQIVPPEIKQACDCVPALLGEGESPSMVRWLRKGDKSFGCDWAGCGSDGLGGLDNPGGHGDYVHGRCACGSRLLQWLPSG